MTPDQFIQAKKNAMKTKTDRKLWLEAKIKIYQSEADDVQYVLDRDQKVLSKLEAAAADHQNAIDEVTRAQARLIGLTGDEFDFALRSYMNSKTALDQVEADMRAIYYAK